MVSEIEGLQENGESVDIPEGVVILKEKLRKRGGIRLVKWRPSEIPESEIGKINAAAKRIAWSTSPNAVECFSTPYTREEGRITYRISKRCGRWAKRKV
jgi:hypothetical protein